MKNLLIFFFVFLSFCSLNAQNVTIAGKVTDLSGNPINNQAVYINNSSGSNPTVYTDSNGDYSSSHYVGNQQSVVFNIEVFDNCGGLSEYDTRYFNINTTGYYLTGNDFSICNNPSNCSVSYTTSQINNGVNYVATPVGTAPFEISWESYIPSYSNPADFTKFHPSNGNTDISKTVYVKDATGCTASYTDTIDVLPSSTIPCYTTFEAVYLQPNRIHMNYYGLFSINYGDGSPLTYDREKTYNTSGTYNVCITKSNSWCTFTYCDSVTITVPTTCNAELNSYDENNYYASFSTNGTVGAAPISYVYDYGS